MFQALTADLRPPALTCTVAATDAFNFIQGVALHMLGVANHCIDIDCGVYCKLTFECDRVSELTRQDLPQTGGANGTRRPLSSAPRQAPCFVSPLQC